MFLFCYGSLIWDPGFDYIDKIQGYIPDYTIRLWQPSDTYYGTSYKIGRVATIVPEPNNKVNGILYEIDDYKIIDQLMKRENGYKIVKLDVTTVLNFIIPAYVFIGINSYPEKLIDTAKKIAHAHGSNGPNLEYLYNIYSNDRSNMYLYNLLNLVYIQNPKKYKCIILYFV